MYMNPDIEQKLTEQSAKIDAIYSSVEKTRKYFQIVLWITIAMIVLPLLGLIFVIPTFISTYASFQGLL